MSFNFLKFKRKNDCWHFCDVNNSASSLILEIILLCPTYVGRHFYVWVYQVCLFATFLVIRHWNKFLHHSAKGLDRARRVLWFEILNEINIHCQEDSVLWSEKVGVYTVPFRCYFFRTLVYFNFFLNDNFTHFIRVFCLSFFVFLCLLSI